LGAQALRFGRTRLCRTLTVVALDGAVVVVAINGIEGRCVRKLFAQCFTTS